MSLLARMICKATRRDLFWATAVLVVAASAAASPGLGTQPRALPDRSSREARNSQAAAVQLSGQQAQQSPQSEEGVLAKAPYDANLFQPTIPMERLAVLKDFAGSPSGNVERDKQFRKLLKLIAPNCIYHYGRDMTISEALDAVVKYSPLPVTIRNDRYWILAGRNGPYLGGRGFGWIDLQTGIALGGFYFQPTNGEPTPSLTIFSNEVRAKYIEMSQLPAEFAADLRDWSRENRVPALVTRYFIGSNHERILLEHDEDYCSAADSADLPSNYDCEQANADAADLDMTAAYYLEQIHHATNGTAWMITGRDQAAWIVLRNRLCGGLIGALACRVRMTREHIRVITRGAPLPNPPVRQKH